MDRDGDGRERMNNRKIKSCFQVGCIWGAPGGAAHSSCLLSPRKTAPRGHDHDLETRDAEMFGASHHVQYQQNHMFLASIGHDKNQP